MAIEIETPEIEPGVAETNNVYSISDVFTPNGDGQNDVWDLTMLFEEHQEANVRIFNRHLKLLKTISREMPQWQGTDDYGLHLPTGNYFYVIEFNDGNMTRKYQKNYVALLR
ncbi:MAG: T9SS type B sorting domain-containing protein [Bacteroidales bacterium]|nr:T9SS type B sorting domain-containing protein [Bacteroidales bacterium]